MNYKTTWGAVGIALASAVALNVSAEAADLGAPPPHTSFKDEPILVAPLVWAGPYVGGHLGGAWTNNDGNFWYESEDSTYYSDGAKKHGGGSGNDILRYGPYYDSLDDNHFVGGVHAGYNWQSDWFVGGVEGDIDWAENIDYLATIRGRFGVAANRWLVYGTAGVAFAGFNFDHSYWRDDWDHDPIGCNFGHDETGWVIGGGVEVKLSPGWSLGVEALYYSFDDAHRSYDSLAYDDTGWRYGYDSRIGGDFTVVRGRISYHFLNGFGRGYDPIK